jgi:hypothetical protein
MPALDHALGDSPVFGCTVETIDNSGRLSDTRRVVEDVLMAHPAFRSLP